MNENNSDKLSLSQALDFHKVSIRGESINLGLINGKGGVKFER